MRHTFFITIGILLSAEYVLYAGDLEPSGSPTHTNTAMYKITDIYSRLRDGITASDFQTGGPVPIRQPTEGPTNSTYGMTGPDLNDCMAIAPVADNANGATTNDVRSGRAFWCLQSSGWGMQTGAAPVQILSPGSSTMTNGYYASNDLAQVDTDLVASNICMGVTIFGVTGASNLANTSSGDADSGDILSGKTAWVDGNLVAGNITPQMLSATTQTVSTGYYATTTLNQVDPDLSSANIKDGVNIFGVPGSAGSVAPRVPLPRTGQTLSYQTGDDGNLQRGKVWPSPRFTAGTGLWTGCVTDNLTGLMWAQNASATNQMNWSNAVVYCDNLSLGATNDWRLPNIRELRSLMDYSQYEPALPSGHSFTNATWDTTWGTNFFWSSTTVHTKSTEARYLDLRRGETCYTTKTSLGHAWPVRNAQ